jgi:hypothetical protein
MKIRLTRVANGQKSGAAEKVSFRSDKEGWWM